MTKIISVFLAVLLVFSLCSCNKETVDKAKPNISDEVLNRVLDVDRVITFTVDDTVEAVRTVTLNGTVLNLTYKQTGYHPLGDYHAHRYTVDGDESKVIDIDINGNIIRIGYTYMTLDISKTATSDEVLAKLIPELEKIKDLSKYEHIKINDQGNGDNGFGEYDFNFHNLEDGIVTDYLYVSVSDDGGVSDLRVLDLPDERPAVNVNEDTLNDIIEAKLMKTHNTDNRKYVSFEKWGDYNNLTVHKGEYYIDCYVIPKFIQFDSEVSGFVISLLIPLDLVND